MSLENMLNNFVFLWSEIHHPVIFAKSINLINRRHKISFFSMF